VEPRLKETAGIPSVSQAPGSVSKITVRPFHPRPARVGRGYELNKTSYPQGIGVCWADKPLSERVIASYYWSSTTYANNSNNAWIVNFNNGNVNNNKSNNNYVRCVRGGK
jgi:hypothetical protein